MISEDRRRQDQKVSDVVSGHIHVRRDARATWVPAPSSQRAPALSTLGRCRGQKRRIAHSHGSHRHYAATEGARVAAARYVAKNYDVPGGAEVLPSCSSSFFWRSSACFRLR